MSATNPEAQRTDPVLNIVICTYDNPALLDRALGALAKQKAAGGGWDVVVVDNHSADDTRQVVARHALRGSIPGLRRVEELKRGLTPARLRGVRSTRAPWIAFVDDDCVLDERWVARALAFAATHPDCGGFGGRVIPDYAGDPPNVLNEYGWAFAEQALGDEPVIVDCLVGAGMVLNRSALEQSGWPIGPYFSDRIGRRLVSGGDVEIALRVSATGRPLWYTPQCALRHLIPAHRTSLLYLLRLTYGLGVSSSISQALIASQSRPAWLIRTARHLVRSALDLSSRSRRMSDRTEAVLDALLSTSYEVGRWAGFARVATLVALGRCNFFGEAHPSDIAPTATDDVVHAG